MTPPRVVLDTNVLLDLWVFDDAGTRWLADALDAGRVRPLRTAAIDAELAEVLGRAYFGLAPPRREEIVTKWQALAEPRADAPAARIVCSDRDDQKFVDLALHARALLLLTKDRALLKLARRTAPFGVTIARPDARASALLERLAVDQHVP